MSAIERLLAAAVAATFFVAAPALAQTQPSGLPAPLSGPSMPGILTNAAPQGPQAPAPRSAVQAAIQGQKSAPTPELVEPMSPVTPSNGTLPALPTTDISTLDKINSLQTEAALLKAQVDVAKAKKELSDLKSQTDPDATVTAVAAPSANGPLSGYDANTPAVVVRVIFGLGNDLTAVLETEDGATIMAKVGSVTPSGWRVSQIQSGGMSEVVFVNDKTGHEARLGVGGAFGDARAAAYAPSAAMKAVIPPNIQRLGGPSVNGR